MAKVTTEFIWRKTGSSCGFLFSRKAGNGKYYCPPRKQAEGGAKLDDQVNSLSEKSYLCPQQIIIARQIKGT